jgi:hypothetical protein
MTTSNSNNVKPEAQSEGIPFVITNAMKVKLRAYGFTDEAISNMTPQEAHEELKKLDEPTTAYKPSWKRWHEAGFTSELLPIIPPGATMSEGLHIKDPGKVPGTRKDDGTWIGFMGWPMFQAAKESLKRWEKMGAGIGINTRSHPAMDIDVEDAGLVKAIHDMAREALGDAPVRYRENSARILLMYRGSGFRSRKLNFRVGDKAHLVEFLGTQYVIDAVHKSGEPYKWREDNSYQHPCDLKPEGLTLITAEKVDSFFETLVGYVEAIGGEIIESKKSKGERDENAGKRVADEDEWTLERCEHYLAYGAQEVSEGARDNVAVAVANRFYDFAAEEATVGDLLSRWNEEKVFPPLEKADIERIAGSAMRSRDKAIGSRHWTTWLSGFEAAAISEPSPELAERIAATVDWLEDDANAEAERVKKEAVAAASGVKTSLAYWLARDLPEPDYLMGAVLSTSTGACSLRRPDGERP